jgi:hypothetical protein
VRWKSGKFRFFSAFHGLARIRYVKQKTLVGGLAKMVDQVSRRSTLLKPEPIMISELQVHAEIRGWLFAEEVQVRIAKNGRPFRQLRLRDQRGNEIKAIQFDLPPKEMFMPQGGKIVLIEGVVEDYQNNTQIKLFYGI